VDVSKSNIVNKIDSTSVIKEETTINKSNYVNITTDTDELEIIPIDSTKPIIINDKVYFNAVLRYKKTKVVLVDTSKTKVSKNALKSVTVKKTEKSKTFIKKINKKSNYIWWIIIIIATALGIYTYKKYALKYLSL
jgi:magnesium-transporting ATPase (P-type)